MDRDVVFMLRDHPARDELQYALRSLDFIDHGTVYFIGGMPDWVRNVEHVPFDGSSKWRNLDDKFRALAFFNDTATTEIYTPSLLDAFPI